MKAMTSIFVSLLLTACAAFAEPDGAPTYQAHFEAAFQPESGTAAARLTITQTDGALRRLDFNAPSPEYGDFQGDGKLTRSGNRLIWRVPKGGGQIRYSVRIDHKRNGAYDARITDDWVIARLDDLFPPARVSTLGGAASRSSMTLDGPDGWSFETRYGRSGTTVEVREDDRKFDRPTGWMVAGRLGIRREPVGGREVAVAAPAGYGFRRLDVLAFLRWTLPTLVEVFPGFPAQLLVVGTPPEMWRGGLSGPGSLYLHGERPLISENGTSPLLHELVHVATAHSPADGDDWIVEGLAEYYGLEILRRTGTISEERFDHALAWLADWSRENQGRLADPSTGADTAEAVLLFHALNRQLKAADASLDQVVVALFAEPDPNRDRLRRSVEGLLGHPSEVLDAALANAPKQQP